MKCKLITTASDINRTMHLQRSLNKFGWEYHIIQHEWTGFGKIPHGMFSGIETVSRAVDELLPNAYYKEIASVVHIRVFQRVK